MALVQESTVSAGYVSKNHIFKIASRLHLQQLVLSLKLSSITYKTNNEY